MSIPQNPDTIVLKNKYYPQGLREIDIWNYYQKVKIQLLRETLGKRLIVFFATDINKFIVIRKDKTKGSIRLLSSNYNTIVSGRTISFHNVMDRFSNYGIIDIDTNDFEKVKDLIFELYDFLYKKNFVKDIKIIYTGKDSFHLRIFFNSEYKIEYIKDLLFNTLQEATLRNPFTIRERRIKNIPNLDLQRNVYNAGYISLHSLSVDGLRVVEVPYKRLKNFKKEMVKIL
jgi:hypothetical protein